MNYKELQKLKKYCDILGAEDLATIEGLYFWHKKNGEALLTTLRRLAVDVNNILKLGEEL